MEKISTSERLKEIMSSRNLRQVDILELTKPFCEKHGVKLNKSDLSQYVSGLVEPGQEKLSILGMALEVSEAWLMGFDVPMERHNQIDRLMKYNELTKVNIKVNRTENEIINRYRKADSIDKAIVLRTLHIDEDKIDKKDNSNYTPTEEDIRSLVARNGKKMTREEAIEFITTMFEDEDEE